MHPCRFVCVCAGDTVIWELNFTPCAFAIVRESGSADGQQGEDGMGNLREDEKGRDSWQREEEKCSCAFRGLMSEVGGKSLGEDRCTVPLLHCFGKKQYESPWSSFCGKNRKLKIKLSSVLLLRVSTQHICLGKSHFHPYMSCSITSKEIPLRPWHESSGETGCKSKTFPYPFESTLTPNLH